MTRSATRSAPLTLGIIGRGELPRKTVSALLDGLTTDAEAEIIVIATKDHLTRTVAGIVNWAEDVDLPYVAITDASTATSSTYKNVATGARSTVKSDDPGTTMVNLLRDADGDARLLFLSDETDDDDLHDVLLYADQQDVACFDLGDGLEPIRFGDDDDEQEPADEEEEEQVEVEAGAAEDEHTDDVVEAAPKRGRGRPRKVRAEDDEETPVVKTKPAAGRTKKPGIYALRAELRTLENVTPKSKRDREIGRMTIEEVTAILRGEPPLEETIATAAHKVTSNGHGGPDRTMTLAPAPAITIDDGVATVLADLVELLAGAVAERVKELVVA